MLPGDFNLNKALCWLRSCELHSNTSNTSISQVSPALFTSEQLGGFLQRYRRKTVQTGNVVQVELTA